MTEQVELDEAEFPHGWVLDRFSYSFHRTFTHTIGRPALLGEYSRLGRQVRSQTAERITDTAWRVVTDTGEAVVLLIRRQGRHVSPIMVLPLAWRPTKPDQLPDPPVTETAPPTPPPPAPAPPPPAPTAAPVSPPTTSPIRLTLGTKSATAVLQARLRNAVINPVG